MVHIPRICNTANNISGEILAFSVSHNDVEVSLHAYYLIIDGTDTNIHHKTLIRFSIDEIGLWQLWNFVGNVYEMWAPAGLDR